MSEQTNGVPDSFTPSGVLKVLHLSRLWARHVTALRGEQHQLAKTDLTWDRIVLDGLGVALEDARTYIAKTTDLEEFERWILSRNGGSIDRSRIERINRAISDDVPSDELKQQIADVDAMDAVLTESDLAHWDEHGYVIVREAISRESARAAETAVWNHLGMRPDDAVTWYAKPIGKGIMTEFYYHPSFTANRASMRIRKAFAQLWGTADLWTSVDRGGFNPPEANGFVFPGPRLHWDVSLTPPHAFGTQGVLYLCDTAADQGAFICIPGFHRRLESWLHDLPSGAQPREEILQHEPKAIAANAGDLIIWHQSLPHGSSPNRASYPRIVQYLNMYPAWPEEDKEWR